VNYCLNKFKLWFKYKLKEKNTRFLIADSKNNPDTSAHLSEQPHRHLSPGVPYE